MVRQASCDVSDRNDKGSPDTVWQILGSCRASFSCSTATAAQTKISALASRRETLLSEQGCLCQALKRCPASAFTREHTNLCSCPWVSRARRQLGDAGEAEGSRASPPPAPPSLAEVHSSTQPALPGPREPYLTLLLVFIPKGGKAHSANLGHTKQRALHVRAFKAPRAPRQGEATAQNALFLLPKLRACVSTFL